MANKAGLKAMIMNRIADVIFILGIILIILIFKTSNLIVVFNLISFVQSDIYNFLGFNFNIISLISFFLFVGVLVNQPNYYYILDCPMQWRTYSCKFFVTCSYNVTAGVFLILRCSPIFEYSSNVLVFVTVIGE